MCLLDPDQRSLTGLEQMRAAVQTLCREAAVARRARLPKACLSTDNVLPKPSRALHAAWIVPLV